MQVRRKPDAADNDHDAAVAAIAFARQWLPYGGADSYEIFTTFGLTPAQFAQRLRRALDTPAVVHQTRLTPDGRDQLRDEARRMATMAWSTDADSTPQQQQQVS